MDKSFKARYSAKASHTPGFSLDATPKGTISEYWLGCPLLIGEKIIGAIVVQSYDAKNVITFEDRDLLSFVSELLAVVIENKHLEEEQIAYQSNLEKKKNITECVITREAVLTKDKPITKQCQSM